MGLKNVIIGIDPGTLFTGYGVVEDHNGVLRSISFGVIESKSKMPMVSRLHYLGARLGQLIEEFKPKAMALEKTFFAKNADSAMKLGQARGVCLYEATRLGLPVHEYNPTEVKKGLTGSGRAEKDQVQMMVQVLLEMSPGQKLEMTKLDMSDALALAIHHLRITATMDKWREAEL